MMINNLFGLILLLLFQINAIAADRSFTGWQKTKEEKDITVYMKESETDGLLAFGGVGELDEPFMKVASVLMDVSRLTEWMADLEVSKVVRWTAPNRYIEFDHIGTPFVIKDREFLTEVNVTIPKEKNSITFQNHDVEDPEFPKDKYVRGKLEGSTFELTSIDGGKRTKFHAEIHADPMGGLPKWVVNLFQKGWPIDTFNNLKKQLKKPDLKTHPKITELLG
ncbi:MAG: hypothetical protein KA715_11670 [Xanthomonadaceae bacterium]|nr:hypothetical protein [Xanthomonadaceae bacterium]